MRGESVELTAREFDLLEYLAKHPGRVFRRADLLDRVWGYGHEGYEHTVNSHINRLRAKIEARPVATRDDRHGLGRRLQVFGKRPHEQFVRKTVAIALLVAIVLLMGSAFYVVDRFYTRAYYEELSQKLNAPIAMYVTEQRQFISNGAPDLDSLRELAESRDGHQPDRRDLSARHRWQRSWPQPA